MEDWDGPVVPVCSIAPIPLTGVLFEGCLGAAVSDFKKIEQIAQMD